MVTTVNDENDKSPTGKTPTGDTSVKDVLKDKKVHDKYNSEDADVTLISSDDVVFKVHSYRLQAGSTVFRSLLSIAQTADQRAPISLTDEFLEHSWVLKSLLDCVYDVEVTCLSNYFRTRAVIDLAEKWNFEHVVKIVKREFLHQMPSRPRPSFTDLPLALALRDEKSVNNAVESLLDAKWSGPPDAKYPDEVLKTLISRQPYLYDKPVSGITNKPKEGIEIFDLGGSTLGDFRFLSPVTVWAILRARHEATTQASVIDKKVFKTELKRLLKIVVEDDD